MASLISGYEYDIFISYRHNDNLDGWVTDFVQNLDKELRRTIKEPVSIYFDNNPHDGLLETHDVDKSLEGKLKCLIFIPILSQTYCDRKSFAWEHEFCAFNQLSKEDPIGRDIKLSNGNVANRILPIKIHDLDKEDTDLLERELGGISRALDFIYRSYGVNRPLHADEDHPHDNINKIYYRDQINKVANAFHEIILGINNKEFSITGTDKGESFILQTNKQPVLKKLAARNVFRASLVYIITALIFWKIGVISSGLFNLKEGAIQIITLVLIVLFPIAILMAWMFERSPEGFIRTSSAVASDNHYRDDQKKPFTSFTFILLLFVTAAALFILFPQNVSTQSLTGSAVAENTIAVLPFQNMSNDTAQLYFCDGFMEELLNNLQKVRSFTVRPRTSSDQYSESKKTSKVIGSELKVNYLVGGSVGREGSKLRIWVHLIDSKADKQIWSNEYNREMKEIFSLQTEIAKDIATELKAALSPEERERIEKKPTENLEAYNFYMKANFYTWKSFGYQDFNTAIEFYKKAIDLDPGFASAYTGIASCLLAEYWFYEDRSNDVLLKSKQAIDKAFELDPNLPEAHLALGTYYYQGFLKYQQALEQFEIVLKDQPKNSEAYFISAAVYRRTGNWEKAKSFFVKAFELDPRSSALAKDAAETFYLVREYPKAEEYFNKAIMLQPDWVEPKVSLVDMILRWTGDTGKAREILGNAVQNENSLKTDSIIIERNILIGIYDGNYEEALKNLSIYSAQVFQNQFYFRPKFLYYATIYGLMNKQKLEHSYWDSTRVALEKKIIELPEDSRLYSTLGIAYAGLGLNDKAISTGEKAVQLLPVSKEAWRGIFLVENLAHIYVMVGKYDKAIEQIKYLLSVPGYLSTKMLELDPVWAPLKNQPEFRKIIELARR